MRAMRLAKAAPVPFGLVAFCAMAQPNPFAASLADPLLGSRAQARVLQMDDQTDAQCAFKRFTAARIARPPEIMIQGRGVEERRWVELWSLDRCGRRIDYWLFFFDLGGGAYFSAEPVL